MDGLLHAAHRHIAKYLHEPAKLEKSNITHFPLLKLNHDGGFYSQTQALLNYSLDFSITLIIRT